MREWIEELLVWHEKHYFYIHSQLPEVKAKIKRMQEIMRNNLMWTVHKAWRKRMESRVTNLKKNFLMDDSVRFANVEAYSTYVRELLEKTWEYGVQTISEKLSWFGLDAASLRFPQITFNNSRSVIEAHITDKITVIFGRGLFGLLKTAYWLRLTPAIL